MLNIPYNKTLISLQKKRCDFDETLDRNQCSPQVRTYDKTVICQLDFSQAVVADNLHIMPSPLQCRQTIREVLGGKYVSFAFLCSAICIVLSGREDK